MRRLQSSAEPGFLDWLPCPRGTRAPSGRARARLTRAALLLTALLAPVACRAASQEQNPSSAASGPPNGPRVSLVSVSPSPPTLGPAAITVALTDPTGQPITGARLQVEADMAMAGMRPSIGVMTEVGSGRYLSHGLSFSMGGNWILTVYGTLPNGTTISRTLSLPPVGGWSDP